MALSASRSKMSNQTAVETCVPKYREIMEGNECVKRWLKRAPLNTRALKYEIEWYDNSLGAWSWVDWGAKIVAGTPLKDELYVPGDVHNPVLPGQILGQRPATITDKSLGHIRITINIAASPPMGLSTSFTTTCTGTEKL